MKQLNRLRWIVLAVFILLIGCTTSPPIWAADAVPAPQVKFTALDANGDPYVGGKLYTYRTGTTTPKTTWTSCTKGAPNTNPVILDSRGQADIWIDSSDGAYRFKLNNFADVHLWTKDGVFAASQDVEAILGDGFSGRVLRSCMLMIRDGTDAASLRLQLLSQFNGDITSSVNNVGKGDSTTYYNLNVVGNELFINAAAFTGDPIGIISSSVAQNRSTVDIDTTINISGDKISILLYGTVSGATQDMTTLVDTGQMGIVFAYITDE